MLSKIRNSPALGGGLAVAILGIAAVVAYFNLQEKTRPLIERVWFYDVTTNKVFVGSTNDLPPIKPPSGAEVDGEPAGVRVYKYGCGDCSEPFLAYLLKYTQDALKASAAGDASALEPGIRVRAIDGEEWFSNEQEEAGKITSMMLVKCGKVRPIQCNPIDEGMSEAPLGTIQE